MFIESDNTSSSDDPPPARSNPYEAVPAALRERAQWVVWRFDQRDGKRTKVPYAAATGSRASATDPSTWCAFETACAAAQQSHYDGIGFVFTAEDAFCGIDLDECIDDDGHVVLAAQQVIDELNSYTEISPSGRGVKIFIVGKKPEGAGCRSKAIGGLAEIEIYDRDRYFTVTGQHVTGTPSRVEERQTVLDALCTRLWPTGTTTDQAVRPSIPATADDEQIIARARRAANSAKFEALFDRGDTAAYGGDDSAADEALCCLLAFYTRDSAQIERLVSRSALGTREKWQTRPDYRARTINAALAFVTAQAGINAPRQGGTDDGDHTSDQNSGSRPFPCTDLGNAERFAQQHGGTLRYCQSLGTWFVWDGARWAEDQVGTAIRLACETARWILDEARRCDNRDQREQLANWAMASEHRSRLEAMVVLARAQPALAVTIEQFDADPWALNTMSGTIDLITGDLRPHRREDMLTKLSPVPYDPDALCPLWERFLDRIMAGDRSLIDYLRRFFGYSLTGGIELQFLPILHGVGANGKSVFVDTIKAIAGDYACDAPPSLLVKSGREEHPTEIADLLGRRLVIASETEDGATFKMQLVKRLTGDATLKGRRMRQDFFEFRRTHKTVLVTNNRPRVKEDSEAVWRRLHLVPFNVVIPPDERDPHLLEKLRAEAPGILAWLVRGCLECRRDGLRPPDAVKAATAEYRGDEDAVGRFLEECFVLDEPDTPLDARSSVAWKDLAALYSQWCTESGEKPLTSRKLGQALEKRGLTSKTHRDGKLTLKVRVGLRMVDLPVMAEEGERS